MLKMLSFIPGVGPAAAVLSLVPPVVWKWAAIALMGFCLYLAGDFRGRRIEIAKCEARAAAAQKAANDQDLQAERDARKQDAETIKELSNQKWVDDATIENLSKQVAARPAGSKCEYDDSTLDPDERGSGGVRNSPGGKRAGDKKHPGPAVVPQPRSRP